MPIKFLLDEHLRGPLWDAICRHNVLGGLPVDALRVGDLPDLPLGAADPEILVWAEREQRILITEDRNTMPRHLKDHLLAGNRSPGVFVVVLGCSIAQMVTELELVAHAGNPADYENVVTFVP